LETFRAVGASLMLRASAGTPTIARCAFRGACGESNQIQARWSREVFLPV
jgi:hypothetical protein